MPSSPRPAPVPPGLPADPVTAGWSAHRRDLLGRPIICQHDLLTRSRRHGDEHSSGRGRVVGGAGGARRRGCTEKKVASDDPSVQVVEVALSDVGCEPNSMSAKAGATTFAVSNEDSSGVTEFELMTEDKGRVLGEAENVGPGLESSFSLNLEAGSYTTYCPGGSKEYGTLEVAEADTGQTGDPARPAGGRRQLPRLRAAAGRRGRRAGPAVRRRGNAGDVAKAQSLFAWAREPYESIEPIAESFGDLDPLIDAREGDVPAREVDRLPPHRAGPLGRPDHRGHGAARRPAAWPT